MENKDQIESLVRELEEKAAYAYGDSSAYINTYIACGIIRSFLLTHDQEVREKCAEIAFYNTKLIQGEGFVQTATKEAFINLFNQSESQEHEN